jgi:hypothetical protein
MYVQRGCRLTFLEELACDVRSRGAGGNDP